MYGIRVDYTPNYFGSAIEERSRNLVASFDNFELAYAYEKLARLKTPKKSMWADPILYKSSSHLANCSDYELEEEYTPPHNPENV